MDESRIGQYSISVTTYPIMALNIPIHIHFWKNPDCISADVTIIDD